MDFLKKYSDSDSEDDSKQITEPHPGRGATGSNFKKATADDVDSDVQSVDMSMSDDEESNEAGTPKLPVSRSRKSSEHERVVVKPIAAKNNGGSKEEKHESRSLRHHSPHVDKDRERDKGDRKREHDHRDRHHERDDREVKSSKRYRDNDRHGDDSKHDRGRHGHRSHKESRNTYKDSRKRDDRDYRHEKDHRRKDDYSDRRDRRYKDDRSGERRSSSSYQKSSDEKYSESRRPPSKDYEKRPEKQPFRKRSPTRSRSKSPTHATKSVPVTEPLLPQRSPPSTSNNLNVAITNNPRMERIRNMKLERLEKLGIDISSQFGNQTQLATPPPSLLSIETTAPPGLVTSVPPPTGITLPAYYNPAVINPTKYADQVQKRKLLWSGKKSEPVEATKWGNTKFSQDTEGKVASKFMRLMGIKNAPAPQDKPDATPSAPVAASSSAGRTGSDTMKKQEELFSTMEQQYEVARQVTHTMRGVGLGFGTSRPF